MLFSVPRRLRALPAVSTTAVLALLSLGQGSAFARTEDANVISLATLVIPAANLPAAPRGNLLLANDGNIYFTGVTGGTNNIGGVASMTPDGVATPLHSFVGGTDDGQSPFAGVIQASDGNLYGTTYVGGDGNGGTVYRLGLDGTFKLLHSFKFSKTEPHYPYAGLVQAGDGNLYGVLLRGGVNDKGTVFRIGLDGTYTSLHDFTGDDGENPEGTLAVGPDGNLYGTTLQGGTASRGTIFRVTLAGVVTSVYSFPGLGAFSTAGVATNATGANPRAGLMLGADGNFYGTAYQGGPNGYGTVFSITPAGSISVVHAFSGPTGDGAFPLSSVSQDAAGNLYGTTEHGGGANQGSAWRINTAGQFSLLHGFTGTLVDGYTPYATLLPLNGYLYGAAYSDRQRQAWHPVQARRGRWGQPAGGGNHFTDHHAGGQFGHPDLVLALGHRLHHFRGMVRLGSHIRHPGRDAQFSRHLQLRAQLYRPGQRDPLRVRNAAGHRASPDSRGWRQRRWWQPVMAPAVPAGRRTAGQAVPGAPPATHLIFQET